MDGGTIFYLNNLLSILFQHLTFKYYFLNFLFSVSTSSLFNFKQNDDKKSKMIYQFTLTQ